jgi:hypothetical protein
MPYYTSRITASDGRGKSFYIFGSPLETPYSFTLEDMKMVANDYDLIPKFLGTSTNEQIKEWVKVCEKFVPITPEEERIVKEFHFELCGRLAWIPKVLSHRNAKT